MPNPVDHIRRRQDELAAVRRDLRQPPDGVPGQRAGWVVALPGRAVLTTVPAFNLMADGLRDSLDPILKR